MKMGLELGQIWWDEHLKEVYVGVASKNVWANITYYTDSELKNYKKLNLLIEHFVQDLKPFEWNDGDNFKIRIYPKDKVGHIKVDFSLKNGMTGYLDDAAYCECSLIFDLGQIEKLCKQILNFINLENYSVEVAAI